MGELAALWLGLSLVPATSLDAAMAERTSATVRVIGTVRQISRTSYGYSYQLSENTVYLEGIALATHRLLVYADDISELKIGNVVSVSGELEAFEAAGNPGQFDADSYYRALGIDFNLEEEAREIQNGRIFPVQQRLCRLRMLLAERLEVLAGEDAGVFLSLFLGDKSQLAAETRAWYELAGISHILAISGLHVSLFGMTLYRLLRRFLLPVPLCGVIGGALAACYVVMTGAGSSSMRALTMFSLYLLAQAVGRTYDLLSALATAGLLLLWEHPLLLGQEGFQLSFLAMVGIGAVWPVLSGWLEACFQEEKGRFRPVKGGRGHRTGEKSRLRKQGEMIARGFGSSLLFSLCIQLATLPVLAWHEGTWAVYGMFLNLMVIPLTGPLLGLTVAASALSLIWEAGAWWLILPARGILRWYETLCRWTEKLPGHTLVLGCPAVWQIVLYVVILLCDLAWMRWSIRREAEKESGTSEQRSVKEAEKRGVGRGNGSVKKTRLSGGSGRVRKTGMLTQDGIPGRVRKSVPAVFLCALFLSLHPLPFRGLQVTFLDVGQGDSIFLRWEEGACLIDGGSSSVSDVGTYRILPYLKIQGITRLSAIFVTHGDEDHCNGLEEVLRDSSLTVEVLVLSPVSAADEALAELRAAAVEEGIPVRVLSAGESWSWGEVDFTCEFPGPEDCEALADDANNASLVLSLQSGDFSALFTGDLGEEGEERWLQRASTGDVTLLQAGHHGSATSSGEAFLELVSPEITVISCGKDNSYGHPHADTLARLAAAGSVIYTTPECGAVTVVKRGGAVRCYAYRK
ncbi:MAG: ComEC/Rec2 family competence protein [Lachnospiraceae bacterium]|nr:ComEC/Rec2 family competence protein [Lachnospiraceae bacterium]